MESERQKEAARRAEIEAAIARPAPPRVSRGAVRWRIADFGEQGVFSIRTAELGGTS
jgi:hypothetical protein